MVRLVRVSDHQIGEAVAVDVTGRRDQTVASFLDVVAEWGRRVDVHPAAADIGPLDAEEHLVQVAAVVEIAQRDAPDGTDVVLACHPAVVRARAAERSVERRRPVQPGDEHLGLRTRAGAARRQVDPVVLARVLGRQVGAGRQPGPAAPQHGDQAGVLASGGVLVGRGHHQVGVAVPVQVRRGGGAAETVVELRRARHSRAVLRDRRPPRRRQPCRSSVENDHGARALLAGDGRPRRGQHGVAVTVAVEVAGHRAVDGCRGCRRQQRDAHDGGDQERPRPPTASQAALVAHVQTPSP